MGWIYCCTTHGPWGRHTIVQPMGHGVFAPLYNPWTMGYKCYQGCCTIHGPWGGHTIVQPMTHGVDILLYNPWTMGYKYYPGCCTIHGLWGKYIIVQPIVHGQGSPPYPLYNIGCPMYHEELSCCIPHVPWGKSSWRGSMSSPSVLLVVQGLELLEALHLSVVRIGGEGDQSRGRRSIGSRHFVWRAGQQWKGQ